MVTKVRTIDFLPEIFKTKPNSQFLAATLDQLVQQPDLRRIQGYIGAKFGYGINSNDKYLVEPSKVRTDYQLEPTVVFKKKDTDKAIDLLTYPGILDSLKLQGGVTNNNTSLFENQFYSWDSFVDLDKLINYSQYYWLPFGPDPVLITTTELFRSLDYIVEEKSTGYLLTTNNVQLSVQNPTLTFIRGGTYTFSVNQLGNFWIQTNTNINGVSEVRNNIDTREVFGVVNNGTNNGTVTFNVPLANSQDEWNLPLGLDVDIATTLSWEDINGKLASEVDSIDDVFDLENKTLIFYGQPPGTIGQISKFYDGTYDTNSLTSTVTLTITDTTSGTNIVTCDSTSALSINEAVLFNGPSLGILNDGDLYFVESIVSSTEFTIALEPGGPAVTLTTASGAMTATVDQGLFENSVPSEINKHYYKINFLPTDSGDNVISLSEEGMLPDNKLITVRYGTEYIGRQFVKNSFAEILLVPILTARLDTLFYIDDNNPNIAGIIKIIDDPGSDLINVNDILGQKTYTSPNNIKFTNGLKITFGPNVFPVEYSEGQYYVEGVGTSIALIPVSELGVPEGYGQPLVNPYDFQPYDTYSFEETTTYPSDQDYITIARNSLNKNSWSRSNRWFHIDVLNTAIANTISAPISLQALGNPESRAKRPIIEFYPNLKLFQSGTITRGSVDFINFTVTDALTQVAGQTSFTPDGPSSSLFDGSTVVFAGDQDPLIRNKIYKVHFSTVVQGQDPVITLTQLGSDVLYDEQCVIVLGENYIGKTYYFDGLNWQLTQQKERVNQPPLFDVFDSNGVSLSDMDFYPSSNFAGSTLFEYKPGSGADDPILGFPISYSSLNNLGDIVFDVTLNSQTFNYVQQNKSLTENINIGYVYNYTNRIDYNREIGWQTAADDSFQFQVFNFKYNGVPAVPTFICDVKIKDSTTTNWPVIVVYVDNARLSSSDYSIATTDNSTTITLNRTIPLGTPVDILLYSDQTTTTGYYQVPTNLDHNPFNSEISSINLGDIRGHYKSIVNNAPDFSGIAFGSNNYRDLGNIIPYGTKIIQNSAPVVNAGAFLRNNYNNFFDALAFNGNEYIKFKAKLIDTLTRGEFQSYENPSNLLDDSLDKITQTKIDSNPFFWSDMLPSKNAYITNTYVFKSNVSTSVYNLSRVYDFNSANYYGVLVYLTRKINGQMVVSQLIKGVDYTVSETDPSLTITTDLVNNDVITIKEYNQTYGSFVPNTPTKLGLYPAYMPEIVYDNTYVTPTWFIKGHDGSYTKLYGTYDNGILSDYRDNVLFEFEKRIYNNLKISSAIPINYDEVVPGQFRDVGVTFEQYRQIYTIQFLNWIGTNRINYTDQYYDPSNPYTYNYRQSKFNFNNQYVKQGNWHGIYLWLYDTTNPDTRPWEMLGLTSKPSWWDTRYGTTPYTKDNTYMWQDIANGYVWNDGNPYVNEQRIRDGLMDIIPVDSNGNLLDPFSNVIGSYNIEAFKNDWIVGDMGAAEFSYHRSSSFPFDLMRIMALTKPARFFALGIDVDNYKYNTEFNQYLYNNRFRNPLTNMTIYGNGTSVHSYTNWLVDYLYQFGMDGGTEISNLITNLDVRLGYRLAGFSDKDLLNFYVEKGTPDSKNTSLLIPDDSYSILLYDNQPTDTLIYSSLIIQRTDRGYKVFGNSQNRAYFTSKIPMMNGLFDTVIVNGLTIQIPKQYYDQTIVTPYGVEFTNVNNLAAFIRGYGLYLESQGFKFDDVENGLQLTWEQMIAELAYWIQTGWDVGSTINVNPCARIISINKENSIVQPLTFFQENFILNQNLIPIGLSDLSVYRNDTEFNVKTLNQGDTISFFRGNLSTFEHVVLFDNITVFNDVIYNLTTGLRQQRIYVKGSKTAEWNGQVNAAGFILNQDNIEEWKENVKYNKGTIVKFKNDYYIADKTVILPSVKFNYNDWMKTDYEMIQKGLLPNPSTRAAEAVYFYDPNKANLESDADLLSFSLIGYRPRQYLADANLDDATQVNVYKNMIGSKGTVESVTRLQGVVLQENTLNYDVHENWAIKTTEFGGLNNQNFIEVTLNETKLTGNPSIVSVIKDESVDGAQQEIPLYNIRNYARPIENENILPTVESGYQEKLPSAGYANIDDMIEIGYSINDLVDGAINTIYKNDYIWVADKKNEWQVYTPYSTGALLINVQNNYNNTVTLTFDKPHGYFEEQVIGIINFDPLVNGYYLVDRVLDITNIIVALTLPTTTTEIVSLGITFLLQSQRVVSARDIDGLPLLNSDYTTNKVWVDYNSEGNWTVYEKTNNYNYLPLQKFETTSNFGNSVAYIENLGYFVGDSNNGTVYHYGVSPSGTFYLRDTFTVPNTEFGKAIIHSNEFVVISQPGSIISQLYIYKIPTSTNINSLTLEQVITVSGGRLGDSMAISDDGAYLYTSAIGDESVITWQLDSVPTYISAGMTLSNATTVGNNTFTVNGQHLTQYQVLSGVTLFSSISIGATSFQVLGNQTTVIQPGMMISFQVNGLTYKVSSRTYNAGTGRTTVNIDPSYPIQTLVNASQSVYEYNSVINQGQSVSFLTSYSSTGMVLQYPFEDGNDFFVVYGDQRAVLTYGDKVSFSNTGADSDRLYTIGLESFDDREISPTSVGWNTSFVGFSYSTVTYPTPPYIAGDTITVSGMVPTAYNGTYTVLLCAAGLIIVANTNSASGALTTIGTIESPITIFFTKETAYLVPPIYPSYEIPAGTSIYLTAFSQNVQYTVVTETYDSINDKTTFYCLEDIQYTIPSGAKVYTVNSYFTYTNTIEPPVKVFGDGYGTSIATNYDGSKMFIGAPYYDENVNLTNTGVAYIYDRLTQNVEIQYDVLNNQSAVLTLPFSPGFKARVYINQQLLPSDRYVVVANKVQISGPIFAGDIVTIASSFFVLSQMIKSQDNISDLRQGENFGYSLDCNKYGSELIVGVPFDVSNNNVNEGSVLRFTNTGKRFGRLTGVIGCNLTEATYILLNGFVVNLFNTINILSTVTTGSTTVTINPSDAAKMPANGVITFQDTTSPFQPERSIFYSSRNTTTGVITFAVPFPFANTFAPSDTLMVVPLGNAANIANAINQTNLDNIRAYATEDNRLQIFLIYPELGQVNNKLNISVFNGNYLFMMGFIDYVKSQTIYDLHQQTITQFGYNVKFNNENSFVVSAPASIRYLATTFDLISDTNTRNDTVFDNNLTFFEDKTSNAGSVYMYNYIPSYLESFNNIGKYVYAQSCNDKLTFVGPQPMYGAALDFTNDKVIIGVPKFNINAAGGRVVIYENTTGINNWHVYRESAPISDVTKIRKVQLYNNTNNQNLASLDYIDPLQGKLLGVVQENLDYISISDPAGYNGPNLNTGKEVWTKDHIGKLWFDTSTTRFINYHQNDVVYNSKWWGRVFPGSDVSVYSWIESDVVPAFYVGPGTVYDIGKYSTVLFTDSNNNLIAKYYYWVRNTNLVFSHYGKTLSDTIISQYITDPKNSGISFMAALRPNTYGLYNSQEYINDVSTNLHLGFGVNGDSTASHVEFQLIRSDYPDDFLTGFPDRDKGYNTPVALYDRLLDSCSGTDEIGAIVPDPYLPKLLQQGVNIRPRQGFFVNRLEALRNYFEYANTILKLYPINEFGNITFLYAQGENFNTTQYWENVYWWAEGYSDATRAAFDVPMYSDLLTLTPKEGQIVGVVSNSQGNREVYVYKAGTWERIGVQNGTIQLLDTLWDYQSNKIGWGDNFFDSEDFDFYPSIETRYIVRALNEQIYINDLFQYRNKSLILLFEYIQSENIESQDYMPWLTKTSFVDVNYTVRELTANEKFQRDNQSLLEGYINEVKPYHVVLKDFYLQYSRTDVFDGDLTDFDLPAQYNDTLGKFVSPELTYGDVTSSPYQYTSTDEIWQTQEYTSWFNNYGITLTSQPNTDISTLMRYIGTLDNEIYVESVYGMPFNGIIKIDSELIGYTGVDRVNNKLVGVSRGVNNTTPAGHFAGTTIFIDLPEVVVLYEGRGYQEPPEVTVRIDTSVYPAPREEAVVQAVMGGDKVIGVSVLTPGSGYVVAPEIVFEPSFVISTPLDKINFNTYTIILSSTDYTTGDIVYSEGITSNGITIIPDGYYYVNVTGIVVSTFMLMATPGNAVTMSFHTSYDDAIRNNNKVPFVNPSLISSGYVHEISIRPRAIVTQGNTKTRTLKPVLKFDRTSYNSRVTEWTPNTYYSSPYISIGNDASNPTKLSYGLPYTGMSGTVSPAGGVSASFTVYNLSLANEYDVEIENGGTGYSPGDVITILGTQLNGTAPTNNCVITVGTVNFAGTIQTITFAGLPVDPSLASLQGAVMPITGFASVDGQAVVTVNYNYSGILPGQVSGSYMYFFRVQTYDGTPGVPANTYEYDDTLAGGAKIWISTPKFNPANVTNQYYIQILDPGSIYSDGDKIVIPGSNFGPGSQDIVNDCIITVQFSNLGAIYSAFVNGVASAQQAQYYVKAISDTELAVYQDSKLQVPVSAAGFLWDGGTSPFPPYGNSISDYCYLPEPIINNYSYGYNLSSIVTYAGIVWQCIQANNDSEFDPTKWYPLQSSDNALNALDRIEGYYTPAITMPGKDPQQLVQGITYPNNVYYGNAFAPDEEIPLDFVLRDEPFYPIDVNVKAVINNGSTLIAACDSPTSSLVLVRNQSGTWDNYKISEYPLGITDMSYENDRYVMSTTNIKNPVLVSYDGIRWITLGTYTPFDTLEFGEGGYDTTMVEAPNLPMYGTRIVNGVFYVVGDKLLRSENGVKFDPVYTFGSRLDNNLQDISYVNILGYVGYIAVGGGGVVTSGAGTALPTVANVGKIVTSVDGNTNWVLQPPLGTNQLNGVASSSTRAVIVGNSGTIFYSTNTNNWLSGVFADISTTVNINSVAFGNSVFVAVGNKIGTGETDPGLILVSSDGITWYAYPQTSQYVTTDNLNTVHFDGSYFYIAGDNDTILRSTNGVNWTDLANINVNEPTYAVKGNDFLFGYGPEELVAGVVTDTLSMYVNTAPGAYWDTDSSQTVWYKHTGFNMKALELVPDANLTVSFANYVVNPARLSVFVLNRTTNYSYRIFENTTTLNNPISYVIDWVGQTITISSALGANEVLMVELYEVGNGVEVVRGNSKYVPIEIDPDTGWSQFTFNQLYRPYNAQPLVYVNGIKLTNTVDYVVTFTNDNYLRLLFINNTYDTDVDYIVFSILRDTLIPYEYSIPETQIYVPSSIGETSIPLDYNFVTTTGDNITNAIVEVNGIRLLSGEYTFNLMSDTLDLTSITVSPDDIVSITTYNDTTRQYLVTDEVTGLQVTEIKFVNTSNNPVRLTFTTDPNFSLGDLIRIDGIAGSVELNNKTFYVNPVTILGDPNYYVDLYTDSATTNPLIGTNVSPYAGTGYAWLDSNTISVPLPTVAPGAPIMSYTDGARTWVTVAGYRINPEQMIYNSDCEFTGSIAFAPNYPTDTYGVLTVTSVSKGSLTLGQEIFGGSITPGTIITSYITGTGGIGTYEVNIGQTVSSASMNTDQTNKLSILSEITSTDDIMITSMVTGESPNPISYNLNVNKYSDGSVYRTNPEDGSWLTQNFGINDTVMYFKDVSNLVDSIEQQITTVNISSVIYGFVQCDINEVKEVQVYNKTTLTQLPQSYFGLKLVNGNPALIFSSGASAGDTLIVTLTIGNIVEILGERIRFDNIDTQNNTISGLTRGVQGTRVAQIHYANEMGYGIIPTRRLTSAEYDSVWNSNVYNPVKGDPLQISQTPVAVFLQSNYTNER